MADSIRGFISIQSAQVFLLPVQNGAHLASRAVPISTTIGIRTSLLDLKTGDFVVVSGRLHDNDQNGEPDEVTVHAIESVGLNELIGTWRSPNWEVVRFEDFTSMSLYRPRYMTGKTPLHNPRRGRMSFSKLKDLNYTLAPEQGSNYSIFLVEKMSLAGPAPIYVGRLSVQKRLLKLEIFDSKTGQPGEVLSLSPVRD